MVIGKNDITTVKFVAQAVRIPFFPTSTASAPAVTKTLAPTYVRLKTYQKSTSLFFLIHAVDSINSASLVAPPSYSGVQHGIRDLIGSVGGVSSIIYLIAMMQVQYIVVLLMNSKKNINDLLSNYCMLYCSTSTIFV
jgi:hypothetical protein